MRIIKATKKDFIQIKKLIEEEFPYTKTKMEKISDRIKKGNKIFVAKQENNFLGFVEFKLNKLDANFFGMVVKKESRRKGIGKKLFDFFIDFCKKNKISKVSLIVKKENIKAKNLYKSKGFVKSRELEKKIDGSIIEKMDLNLNEFKGVS